MIIIININNFIKHLLIKFKIFLILTKKYIELMSILFLLKKINQLFILRKFLYNVFITCEINKIK